MTQKTAPDFIRFHIKANGRRTTISLDSFLVGLLALKLSEKTAGPQTHREVRVWLQRQADAFAGSRELNRHLMRCGILLITDNKLSKRHAAIEFKENDGKLPNPLPQPKAKAEQFTDNILSERRGAVQYKERGRELSRPLSHPKTTEVKRFVLFRAANTSIFPPDVLVWGTSIQDVRDLAKDIFANSEDLRKIVCAEYLTTTKEKPNAYYIRQCSEEIWKLNQRLKKKRREIRPMTDSAGVWRTRKEMVRIKKSREWLEAIHWMKTRGK